MNRIVKEHYPVEKLPEDLREGLGDARAVTLVITASGGDDMEKIVRDEAVRMLLEARSQLQSSPDDSVDRIRALRDEWD